FPECPATPAKPREDLCRNETTFWPASHPPPLNRHLTKSRLNDAPPLCEMQRNANCRGIERNTWNRPGREWMSTSSVAFAGRHRSKSSRTAISSKWLGRAGVACLVVVCGWTVDSNIINASAYPTIGSADHVEDIVRRVKLAERSTIEVIHETFAALPEQPAVVAAITQ